MIGFLVITGTFEEISMQQEFRTDRRLVRRKLGLTSLRLSLLFVFVGLGAR